MCEGAGMIDPPVARLTESLIAAGLPVAGCALLEQSRIAEAGWRVIDRADGQRVRIDLTPGATAEQWLVIRDLVLAHDLSSRRPKGVAALVQALAALTAAELRQLTIRLLAERLTADPRLARRAGLALDGDEVAP